MSTPAVCECSSSSSSCSIATNSNSTAQMTATRKSLKRHADLLPLRPHPSYFLSYNHPHPHHHHQPNHYNDHNHLNHHHNHYHDHNQHNHHHKPIHYHDNHHHQGSYYHHLDRHNHHHQGSHYYHLDQHQQPNQYHDHNQRHHQSNYYHDPERNEQYHHRHQAQPNSPDHLRQPHHHGQHNGHDNCYHRPHHSQNHQPHCSQTSEQRPGTRSVLCERRRSDLDSNKHPFLSSPLDEREGNTFDFTRNRRSISLSHVDWRDSCRSSHDDWSNSNKQSYEDWSSSCKPSHEDRGSSLKPLHGDRCSFEKSTREATSHMTLSPEYRPHSTQDQDDRPLQNEGRQRSWSMRERGGGGDSTKSMADPILSSSQSCNDSTTLPFDPDMENWDSLCGCASKVFLTSDRVSRGHLVSNNMTTCSLDEYPQGGEDVLSRGGAQHVRSEENMSLVRCAWRGWGLKIGVDDMLHGGTNHSALTSVWCSDVNTAPLNLSSKDVRHFPKPLCLPKGCTDATDAGSAPITCDPLNKIGASGMVEQQDLLQSCFQTPLHGIMTDSKRWSNMSGSYTSSKRPLKKDVTEDCLSASTVDSAECCMEAGHYSDAWGAFHEPHIDTDTKASECSETILRDCEVQKVLKNPDLHDWKPSDSSERKGWRGLKNPDLRDWKVLKNTDLRDCRSQKESKSSDWRGAVCPIEQECVSGQFLNGSARKRPRAPEMGDGEKEQGGMQESGMSVDTQLLDHKRSKVLNMHTKDSLANKCKLEHISSTANKTRMHLPSPQESSKFTNPYAVTTMVDEQTGTNTCLFTVNEQAGIANACLLRVEEQAGPNNVCLWRCPSSPERTWYGQSSAQGRRAIIEESYALAQILRDYGQQGSCLPGTDHRDSIPELGERPVVGTSSPGCITATGQPQLSLPRSGSTGRNQQHRAQHLYGRNIHDGVDVTSQSTAGPAIGQPLTPAQLDEEPGMAQKTPTETLLSEAQPGDALLSETQPMKKMQLPLTQPMGRQLPQAQPMETQLSQVQPIRVVLLQPQPAGAGVSKLQQIETRVSQPMASGPQQQQMKTGLSQSQLMETRPSHSQSTVASLLQLQPVGTHISQPQPTEAGVSQTQLLETLETRLSQPLYTSRSQSQPQPTEAGVSQTQLLETLETRLSQPLYTSRSQSQPQPTETSQLLPIEINRPQPIEINHPQPFETSHLHTTKRFHPQTKATCQQKPQPNFLLQDSVASSPPERYSAFSPQLEAEDVNTRAIQGPGERPGILHKQEQFNPFGWEGLLVPVHGRPVRPTPRYLCVQKAGGLCSHGQGTRAFMSGSGGVK